MFPAEGNVSWGKCVFMWLVMNEQFQPLIDLLKGRFGWAPTVIAWMGALRLVLKPFSARVQCRITEAMTQAALDPEDSKDWETVLHQRWYRWTAFFLDLFFSFKLPTHVEFEALMAKK